MVFGPLKVAIFAGQQYSRYSVSVALISATRMCSKIAYSISHLVHILIYHFTKSFFYRPVVLGDEAETPLAGGKVGHVAVGGPVFLPEQ
jgi:hypothetical protein